MNNKPVKRKSDEWTSIAVRKDTHDRLEKMKVVNFDDVIRRGMGMPPIESATDIKPDVAQDISVGDSP